MNDRNKWRKGAEKCEYRIYAGSRTDNKGNPICIMGGIGNRCTFSFCPQQKDVIEKVKIIKQ